VDEQGHLAAVHSAFSPHMTDPRPMGALLAGMPSATSKPAGFVATEWPYDKIQRLKQAFGIPNVGGEAASGGLLGNIMRAPGQRQQGFALERFLNEAAAAAGMDLIEFRIAHTTDQRLQLGSHFSRTWPLQTQARNRRRRRRRTRHQRSCRRHR
jgi:hypothetical protein